MNILLMTGIFGAGFSFLLLTLYVLITAPFAIPFLKAKLSKGMVIILQTQTGKRELVPTDKNFKNKQYGVFLPTEESTFMVGNVPIALGHTDISVIPTKEICDAARKMDEADTEVYTDLESSARNALAMNVIDSTDARSLYRYAANVTPNYVNSRIERKVAEILSERGDSTAKIFTYTLAFVMIMVGAAIAYQAIAGGGASTVTDSLSTTVSTMNI
jgi:hypothetical protein